MIHVPTQTTRQEALFGERDIDHGTFTVDNVRLYPFLRLQRALVDESKFRFTDDGLRVRAVDPANVGMVDMTLDVDHDLGETVAGVNVKRLSGLCQNKPRSVTLDIELARPYGTVSIEQEFANGQVWDVTERFGFIDPGSIRQEPDVPDIDYDATAEVDIRLLAAFIDDREDHQIELIAEDGTLTVAEPGEETDYRAVAETNIDIEGEAESTYSVDYLDGMFSAMKSVGIKTATLMWSTEFPLTIEFETDHIDGMYLLAPRISA